MDSSVGKLPCDDASAPVRNVAAAGLKFDFLRRYVLRIRQRLSPYWLVHRPAVGAPANNAFDSSLTPRTEAAPRR
jgi:hypothetical protein